MSKHGVSPSGAFPRLAWSNLAAQSAEQIALAAAPLLVVLTLGGDASETGLMQAAQTLPFLLFAIPAGMLADRVSRRRLVVAAEGLRAAALLAVVALAYADLLTWPLLALLGMLGACGTVGYSVAVPALLPRLVAREALPRANARIELARTVAFAGGPALGGLLVGASGAAPAFLLAAGLSLVAVLLLSGLSVDPAGGAPAQCPPLEAMREGARFVFQHPMLRPIFVTQFLFNVAFFILLAGFVPYAIRSLGLPAAGVGVVLGVCGVGMVGGALVAPGIMRLLPVQRVILIGPVAGCVAGIVMALTLWIPSPLLAGASFLLLGFGPILWVISTTTLRQIVTPDALLGRVSAINIMAYGARPLGALIGAAAGGWGGAEACILVAAAVFFVQAFVILRFAACRAAAVSVGRSRPRTDLEP